MVGETGAGGGVATERVDPVANAGFPPGEELLAADALLVPHVVVQVVVLASRARFAPRITMSTWLRYRTAPEIAAGLTWRRSTSSADVSRPVSVARRAAKTRAGMRGIPASTRPLANRSMRTRNRPGVSLWEFRSAITCHINFRSL